MEKVPVLQPAQPFKAEAKAPVNPYLQRVAYLVEASKAISGGVGGNITSQNAFAFALEVAKLVEGKS